MLADELTVADFMAVVLETRNPRNQRAEQGLALTERPTGSITTIEMQEIEDVVDQPHSSRAVARGLRLRKARQSVVADAAQFAVEIRGFHRQRC